MAGDVIKLATPDDDNRAQVVDVLKKAVARAEVGEIDFVIVLSRRAGGDSLDWSHSGMGPDRLLQLLGALRVAEHAVMREVGG